MRMENPPVVCYDRCDMTELRHAGKQLEKRGLSLKELEKL